VVVDAELARRLIGRLPELSVESLRPLAEELDRAIWLVSQRWLFGFPRRASVVPGIEREMALLPRLARLLPLPIPLPVFFGLRSISVPCWPGTAT